MMDLGHVRHEREERSGYAITRACSLVFRKCLFPCLRRIPRFTKRYGMYFNAMFLKCFPDHEKRDGVTNCDVDIVACFELWQLETKVRVMPSTWDC